MAIAIIEILVPIFGIFLISLSILIFLLLQLFHKKTNKTFQYDELQNSFTTMSGPPIQEASSENFIRSQMVNSMPYYDIIESGDIRHKLMAVEKATSIRSTASVQILKHALFDHSYEVKYMAKNSLDKIETMLLAEVEMATEAIKHNPRSYRSYNFRANLYLGIEYLQIFDYQSNLFFVQKAIVDLTSSLQLLPLQPDTYLKMATALLKSKEFLRAIHFIDDALAQEVSEIKKIKLIFFKAECFFELREFEKVKQELKNINPKRVSFENITSSLKTWGPA